MMDILYILGHGSRWDNNELRYSLRSLDKYGKNIGRVFICGEKPDFVNDNVTYRSCPDAFRWKHKNIYHKIRTAIYDTDISDHFLISSDDHFIIKETDFDDLPVYVRRKEIQKKTDPLRNSEYFKSLVETRGLLEKYNLPIYQTNPHFDTHFDVNLWRENMQLFDEGMQLPHGGEANCLMGNLLIANGWKTEDVVDMKIKYFANLDELRERLKDRSWFSIYDEAIKHGIGRYLSDLFPYKSRWEK